MLSVVVIGRNDGATLPGCLRSVGQALASIRHELLYVDSGSTDESLPIAQSQGARCFRLRTTRTTAGLARRIGTQEAQGEYLLFLDGDMLLQPGFVETALTVMEKSGYDGATGIRHDVYERDGRVIGENPNYYGCKVRREATEFGGAILLRATELNKAGGWAANVLTCEEAELHARLIKHGARVVELPVPMIRHIDRKRDNRGPLAALITPRRLGLGQALVNAVRMRCLWALLKRERIAFLCWIVDALCVAALCLGGWRSVWAIAAAQALQLAAFGLMNRTRGFLGQKLLFVYLPAGVLSYRKRDEGYDAWVDASGGTPRAASPTE
ncbi:MAG: glycosyltransferase family 2 protein [Clostridia bacterium]|nr:glycosyltransferase family 2 protein [Clostridia bacterium]